MRWMLLLIVMLVPLLGTAPEASADAWGEARASFRASQRQKEWQARREGYFLLDTFDQAASVEECLLALVRESNAAVVLAGIEALARFESAEALAALAVAVREGKGPRKTWALLALADHPGEAGKEVLLEVAQGKDAPAAAQAALGLGRKQVREAVPVLLGLLQSKDWQVRAAAARGLRDMPGTLTMDPVTRQWNWPKPPAWLEPKSMLPALVEALALAQGRERADMVAALERISLADFGWDVAAWLSLAAGTPAKDVKRNRSYPPYICGIPIYGRRVVLVLDESSCTEVAHPFSDRARLQELCKVPGARDVPWYQIRSTKQFFAGHAKRLIDDLPAGSSFFDVVFVATKIRPVFGKLAQANPGTKAAAAKEIDEIDIQKGLDTLEGLNQALDASGSSDAVAWQSGPDEVILMTCSVPWDGQVTDQVVVGATISLKARLRMVPIHSVGVGPHPFDMMIVLAKQTGATYLDLSK